jgi:hypothetical protein
MVVVVERDALVVGVSFRWLTAAPGAAAVKAGLDNSAKLPPSIR